MWPSPTTAYRTFGCSPTIMIMALDVPSPKTVCLAVLQRSQAVQARAARRSTGIVVRGAKKLDKFMLASSVLFRERLDAGFMALSQGSFMALSQGRGRAFV